MNQLTKDKTMEDKAIFNEKKKASAKAYQERKNVAGQIIKEWLESNPEIEPKILEAIKYLTGSGVRSQRSGIISELKKSLLEGPMSLKDIFKKFEYGRPTMDQKIKGFIRVSNPEDRIWVSFHDGVYEVMGQGENPPEGWTGFIPTEKSEL